MLLLKRIVLSFILPMILLAGCASRVPLGPVYFYLKVEPIDIDLRSFSFYPNHIAVLKNESSFTFRLKNTAQIKHNFTLVDYYKNVLLSVKLSPMESTTVTIKSLDSGNYIFYCNRFLHRFFGMEGMLMVD